MSDNYKLAMESPQKYLFEDENNKEMAFLMNSKE